MLTRPASSAQPFVQIGTVEGALALLAFVVAFYALVVRERKTPYLVNTVYTSTIVLYTIVLGAAGAEVLTWIIGLLDPDTAWWQRTIFGPALRVALLGAFVFVLARLLQAQNQHVNLRTDKAFRHFGWVQRLSQLRSSPSKPYKFNAVPFSEELLRKIADIQQIPKEQLDAAVARRNDSESGISIGLRAETLQRVDKLSLALAAAFLRSGANVQYTSCVRHPYEFGMQLHKAMGDDWPNAEGRAVLIDAYTPHFGFSDSVHVRNTKILESNNMTVVEAPSSYAGLHTAASRAFKRIQGTEGSSNARQPTLVIYEGTHALVDLESLQQYKIFARHVIPSERLWGGMLTLFVETAISSADMAVVKSYVDIYLDSEAEEDRAGESPREAAIPQSPRNASGN